MIRRLFYSKLFVLFLSLMITGFFLGYIFSMTNSKRSASTPVNTVDSDSRTGAPDKPEAREGLPVDESSQETGE